MKYATQRRGFLGSSLPRMRGRSPYVAMPVARARCAKNNPSGHGRDDPRPIHQQNPHSQPAHLLLGAVSVFDAECGRLRRPNCGEHEAGAFESRPIRADVFPALPLWEQSLEMRQDG
jgi:hypothetical protein